MLRRRADGRYGNRRLPADEDAGLTSLAAVAEYGGQLCGRLWAAGHASYLSTFKSSPRLADPNNSGDCNQRTSGGLVAIPMWSFGSATIIEQKLMLSRSPCHLEAVAPFAFCCHYGSAQEMS